jgi:hypothetical protein
MTAAIANNEALVSPHWWATRAVALNSSASALNFANCARRLRARRPVFLRQVGLPSSMMATVKKRASLPALFNKQEVG